MRLKFKLPGAVNSPSRLTCSLITRMPIPVTSRMLCGSRAGDHGPIKGDGRCTPSARAGMKDNQNGQFTQEP